MKKTIFLLSLILHFLVTNCQTYQRELDTNNVRTTILNNGSVFSNGTTSKFEVPKITSPGMTPKMTISSSSLWIGAKLNDSIKVMATMYNQLGYDVTVGPIANKYDAAHKSKWDYIWKITSKDIIAFKQNPAGNLTPDILTWPGNGDTTKGESFQLAPFIDTDQDGIYNPYKGDYPKIKGDMCLYTILNDDTNHTDSKGERMKLEIHQMAYSWATNDDLNNTIFLDYKIYNRSQNTYDSFTVSNFIDFDIGNPADDYIGTDTLRNMVYAYNGDFDDDGKSGYGRYPPAQACVILNKPIWNSKYFLNDFTARGNPYTPLHFYHYIMGRFKNGFPQDRYNYSNHSTLYSYDGDPCLKTGWWEGYDNLQPSDRRILAAIAPQQFAPGDFVEVQYAYVYAQKDGGDNASFCDLQRAVDAVKKAYDKIKDNNIGLTENLEQPKFDLYPNPSNQKLIIQSNDNLYNYDYEIISSNGNITYRGKLSSNEIPIENIPNGFYIIKISNGEKSLQQKFIKSRE